MLTQSLKIETERITALKRYNILDTLPDASFDRITKLAAKLFNVPIAIITFVDEDRIWFKSHFGVEISQIVKDNSLPLPAILPETLYVVEDASRDVRTSTNVYVTGQCNLRFYAAAPIKVKEGHVLGAICIMDRNPRQLAEWQQEILEDLAGILVNQLELRHVTKIASDQQDQLLNIAVHDLRNPLTVIPLWADLIEEEKDDPAAVIQMVRHINNAALKMTTTINELLESASLEANQIKLRFTQLNFAKLVKTVVDRNQILARAKDQYIHLHIENSPSIHADEIKLGEIVDNLLNNAIKYSERNKNISITVKQVGDKAILEVADEGLGFTEEDKKNIFQRYKKLSSKPTGKETSTGLGLFIVRLFVEAHKGTISLKSDGKDKGAVFTVEIPVVAIDPGIGKPHVMR